MEQETIAAAPVSEVTVNGRRVTTRATTLAELVAEQDLGAAKVATALNGDFVPERARAATPIGPGDQVEIVSARQGG